MRSLAIACCLFAVAAAGCHRVTLEDDVDLTFNFSPLTGPSDALHSPYVIGARMTVWADPNDDDADTKGWTIESSNPSIFRVEATTYHEEYARAVGQAVGVGQAVLRVRDEDGDLLHEATVEVKVPDTIELLAHGPMLIKRPDGEARTDEPRVLVGGTATFLARYLARGQRLHGNGTLGVQAGKGVTAKVARSFVFEDRDWLQVSPSGEGPQPVKVLVAGVGVRDLTVVGVPASEIVDIQIRGEDESRANEKEWLVALAQAYDGEGRPVYGVAYKWTVDAKSESGLGDLYRYEYRAGRKRMLGAKWNGLETQATIHAGEGYVSSSNFVGCSAAPGRPSRSSLVAAMLLLVFLALVLRGRPC